MLSLTGSAAGTVSGVAPITGDSSLTLTFGANTAEGAVAVAGASSQALALTGFAAGGVAVVGASSATLPLTGSAAGGVTVSGASSQALALTGTAAGVVVVTGASSQALALADSAAGTVSISGASSQALTLGGSAAGSISLSGASNQGLDIGGSAAGGVSIVGASSQALVLTGSAAGVVGVAGSSSAVLALSGSAAGVVAIAGGSSQVLGLTGIAEGSVLVSGSSSGGLTLAGSADGLVTGGAITGDSDLTLALGGSADGVVIPVISGDSDQTLVLDGLADGVIAVAGETNQALVLVGSATGGPVVIGGSSDVFSLGASGFAYLSGSTLVGSGLGSTAGGSAPEVQRQDDSDLQRQITLSSYAAPASTDPSFNRPRYVRQNTLSKARDLGVQEDLLIIATGTLGTESGTNTLFYKVRIENPSKLGIRTPFLTTQQRRWITVGILDANRKPIPLDKQGFGMPGQKDYGDTSDPGVLLPAGEYYFTVTTNQWVRERLEVQMAIIKPTILDGEILLELEVNGLVIGIDAGLILRSQLELALEPEATASILAPSQILQVQNPLELDVTGTIQQPLHGLLELELTLEGELFSGLLLPSAKMLVIGYPKYSLDLSDPQMPSYDLSGDTYELLSPGGIVPTSVAFGGGTGRPGFVVQIGGGYSREGVLTGQAVEPLTELLAFSDDMALLWRHSTYSGVSAPDYQYTGGAFERVIVDALGRFIAFASTRWLLGNSIDEFIVVSAAGLLIQRIAFTYFGNVELYDMAYDTVGSQTLLLYGNNSTPSVVAAISPTFTAGWSYRYTLAAAQGYQGLSVRGLAPPEYSHWYMYGTCNVVPYVAPTQTVGFLAAVDSSGNIVNSRVIENVSAGLGNFSITSVWGCLIEAPDTLVICGSAFRPKGYDPSEFGSNDAFVARISATGTTVYDAIVLDLDPLIGEGGNPTISAVFDDEGNICVVTEAGWYEGLPFSGSRGIAVVHRLSPAFEVLGSNYISCDVGFGGTPESGVSIINNKIYVPLNIYSSWGPPPPGVENEYISDAAVVQLDVGSIGPGSAGIYGQELAPNGGYIYIADLTPHVSTIPLDLEVTPVAVDKVAATWSAVTSTLTSSSKLPDIEVLEEVPGPNWVYSQSSVHPLLAAADYSGMANGSAVSLDQTGTSPDAGGSWVQVMFDSLTFVDSIDVGCDWYDSLPAGVYPDVLITPRVAYSENCNIQITLDGTIWSTVANTGTISSAITNYSIALGVLGIRITSGPLITTAGQLVVTEFKPILG
jgi:hypothetical protein